MRAYILFHVIFSTFVNVRAGFSFNTTTAYQCGPVDVSWTGGQEPFSLTIVPVSGHQTTYELYDYYSKNGVGSFVFYPLLPENQQFVLIMSDGTGFAAGGVSPLTTMRAPPDRASCDSSGPATDVISAIYAKTLEECTPYYFSFANASQPATIYGVVPDGTGTVFQPTNGTNHYTWSSANVAAGTSMIFFMTDAAGHPSIVSNLMVSQSSNDTSCLDSSSPSTTAVVASSSSVSSTFATTTTTTATSNTTTTPIPSSRKLSTWAKSGIAIGGAVVFAGFVAVALLCRRRRRNGKYSTTIPVSSRIDIDEGFREHPELLFQLEPFPTHTSRPSDSLQELTPLASSSSHTTHSSPSDNSLAVAVSPMALLRPTPMVSPRSRTRKVNTVTATAPTVEPPSNSSRVILHRDVGDVIRETEQQEVVELPPSYDSSRPPLIFGVASNDTHGAQSWSLSYDSLPS